MPSSDAYVGATPEGLPALTPVSDGDGHAPEANGHGNGHLAGIFDEHALLHALQTMRLGDFSVRLPGDQTGLSGKIADTFNEIVAANERRAPHLEEVGLVVGREGRTRSRVRFGLPDGAWGEMEPSVNTLIDDL